MTPQYKVLFETRECDAVSLGFDCLADALPVFFQICNKPSFVRAYLFTPAGRFCMSEQDGPHIRTFEGVA